MRVLRRLRNAREAGHADRRRNDDTGRHARFVRRGKVTCSGRNYSCGAYGQCCAQCLNCLLYAGALEGNDFELSSQTTFGNASATIRASRALQPPWRRPGKGGSHPASQYTGRSRQRRHFLRRLRLLIAAFIQACERCARILGFQKSRQGPQVLHVLRDDIDDYNDGDAQ